MKIRTEKNIYYAVTDRQRERPTDKANFKNTYISYEFLCLGDYHPTDPGLDIPDPIQFSDPKV